MLVLYLDEYYGSGMGYGLIWVRKGQVAGSCECGNESSGSKKCGEFLD